MVIIDKLFKQGKIEFSTGYTEGLPKTHALTISDRPQFYEAPLHRRQVVD